MKVRLKLKMIILRPRLIAFQFHEGPIKTIRKGTGYKDKTRFQFHEGPIKTLTA